MGQVCTVPRPLGQPLPCPTLGSRYLGRQGRGGRRPGKDKLSHHCHPHPVYFLSGFLKILRGNFFRPGLESVSSPMEPLSSSATAFLPARWGMRVFRLACRARLSPTGDGVSGSGELGLREWEESKGGDPPGGAEGLSSIRLWALSSSWFIASRVFLARAGLSGSFSTRDPGWTPSISRWLLLEVMALRASSAARTI